MPVSENPTGLVAGGGVAEVVGTVTHLLYLELLLATRLLGRGVVPYVVQVFRRLAIGLIYRLLSLLCRGRVEFILRAAVEIDLLLPALDTLEEENRPRDEQYRNNENRDAARDDLAFVFRSVLEIIYCLLDNHLSIIY